MPGKREWFRVVKATAKAPARATIHINEAIGADPFFGGVDAAELIAEIDGLAVDELEVRINSEGGSAYDGLAIANAIIRNSANTTTYVDGLAASAASLVALAGDKVVMSKYGQMMLHNSRGGVMGTAAELREAAKFLESLNASMAEFYADRAGGEVKDWAKAMDHETWYRADEALAAGLVTEIDASAKRETTEAAVAAAMARPTARFTHPAPIAGAETTGARASVTNHPTKEGVVPLSEKVAKRLGLATDATDDDVLAKLDELDADTEQDPTADTAAAGGAAGAPAAGGDPASEASGTKVGELAAAAAKADMAVIGAAELADLRRQAADGALALSNQVAAAHAKVVDDAINTGRILPTSRDTYLAHMKKDPEGTAKHLADTPAEFMVPMTEMGHALDAQASAQTAEQEVRNDPRYKNWSI